MKKLSLIFVGLLVALFAQAQDLIITTDAQKIDAKILEVSKSEIKYKEFDNLDGPTFILETAEINSIVFSNGKVKVFNSPQTSEPLPQQEEKSEEPTIDENTDIQEEPQIELYLGLQGEERKVLSEYLDGYPKNIVAVKGDYTMLFDKKARVYIDFEYDSAQLVRYWYEEMGCKVEGPFNEYLQTQTYEIDKNAIIKGTCELFNQKMIGKKCKLFPITMLDTATPESKDYILSLHIQRIDVGIGALSVMSSGQTNTGGAILYGYIEIKQAANDSLCSVLIVDRVKGVGNAHEEIRIQHTIEEIIANKLFFIKQYKLYSKDINN